MSKAVLMSIQPKWCELIACGKKTIEIRKTKPKLDVPFKVYIYCTRYEKGKLIWRQGNKFLGYKLTDVSGKIIGEFVCDTVFPISISYSDPNNRMALREFPFTGLSDKDIMDYKKLIECLIGCSFVRSDQNARIQKVFDSGVLEGGFDGFKK